MRLALVLMTALLLALVPVVPPAHAATPLRILPLGDSITAGYGSANTVAGWDGYRATLYQSLVARGYAVQMVGSQTGGTLLPPDQRQYEGYSGYAIATLDGVAGPLVAAARPDLILLQAGTPDFVYGTGLANAPARLAHLLDTVRAAAPQALILVSTIPPITPVFNPAGGSTDAYNAALAPIVAARAGLGGGTALVNAGGSLALGQLFDGVHPSNDGYRQMGLVWADAIAARVQPSSACSSRPPVVVTTAPAGPGAIGVTATATGASPVITSVTFGPGRNTLPVADLAVAGARATFTVRQAAPGSYLQPFVVTDQCGPWSSFAGAGS